MLISPTCTSINKRLSENPTNKEKRFKNEMALKEFLIANAAK